jgi:phage-related protein
MNTMKVNGTSIADKGFYILKYPPISIPQKRVTHYHIPGRSGTLTKWLGDYETIIKTAKLRYEGANPDLNWLGSASYVEFGNEPGYVFDCLASEPFMAPQEKAGDYIFDISFTCQPFKRLAAEEPIIGATVVLENAGNVPCKPRIEITATGTVTVNDITVTGVTGTLVIDNHLGLVYDGAGNAFGRMTGDLFEVSDSLTILANGVMTVYPNQRWV